MTIYIRAV